MTPTQIQAEIAATESHLADLGQKLIQAQRREMLEAQQDKARKETTMKALRRMDGGWWVSCIGNRKWWHTPEQSCVERATADDMEAIRALQSRGLVERSTELCTADGKRVGY